MLYFFCIICKARYTLRGDYLQNRIQTLRKERKLTQNELANYLEVTRQTIISLENGKYNASLILGLTIEEVFIFDEEDEE